MSFFRIPTAAFSCCLSACAARVRTSSSTSATTSATRTYSRGSSPKSRAEPDTLEFFAGQVKVFATHGHRYGVKSTMDSLLNSAHFSGAQLVLYGHTHAARIDYVSGMTVVNPGSSGLGGEPSFAQIDIREDKIAAKILPVSPKDPYM